MGVGLLGVPACSTAPVSPAAVSTADAALVAAANSRAGPMGATIGPADPTSVPLPANGWVSLEPGLEQRSWDDLSGRGRGLYALRVDPQALAIGVAYKPGSPMTLADWRLQTDALVIANAGYFDDQDRATALVVVDGAAQGSSYTGFGGMLAVRDGRPSLTWLAAEPFAGTEGMSAAIQSAPMLVADGGRVYDGLDAERNRRAAVALDGAGRLLLLATTGAGYTLAALADRLLDPELDIRDALNLDGGKSAGIAIESPGAGVPALVPVPAVITIHRRTER